MVFNKEGLVFSGQRLDNPNNSWQLPQGGIDEGESPIQAAFRELEEETSITSVDFLAEYPDWIKYDVPKKLADNLWEGKYRGQTQKWLLFCFIGNDNEINVKTKKPEFRNWSWIDPIELSQKAIYFKKDVYKEINKIFVPLIKNFIN
tara:strand:+ start:306 stop:746 length:441 start_codon:yes stop_codon:yes gene_type:complete